MDNDTKDAERYRWMRDVKCCTISVSRDEGHAINYQSFADWAEELPEFYAQVPADELERMRANNTDWAVQIYPNTPVGSYTFHGATLDAAIDAAIAAGVGL